MYVLRLRLYVSLIVAFCAQSFLYAGVPSGYYYFAKNKKKAALKTALHTYAVPQRVLDFGGGKGFTWEGFFYADQKADGSVIDMYSDSVRYFKGFAPVAGMHIEHSLPKSWWGGYNTMAYRDLFHLYPADGLTNSTKNDLPIGEVTGTPSLDNGVSKVGKNGFELAYSGNCFEPADEYKGDFARSYFYISTVYENFSALWQSPMMDNNTYPVWKPWAIDLLLKWNRQDPVSAKELARIEAVYAIQGNRNPFIDYPDLAEYIWGKDTTSIFPFPEETAPFLLMPRRGASADFGVILANDTRSKTLRLEGVNINAPILVSLLKNSSALSLSATSISAANALSGTDLSITFNPKVSGLVLDTLVIQGGGLTEKLSIPIKALASADFITLEPTEITPVGGTLQWIADPQATDYQLSLYQGDPQAGDLVIASYVEGSSWNKAIELYNETGKTIDLSKYSLQKQSNGAGALGATLKLSGTLANGKSYVIAHPKAAADLLAKAQMQTDSLLSFNGNDAVALLRSGVIIDMVGQADAGADVTWGLDLTLQRKSTVTHPISVFNMNEWTTLPIDTYSALGTHSMTLTTTSSELLQDFSVGKNTTYTVSNLLPTSSYTYKVTAVKLGGYSTAINTMQLHTNALDAPVIMQPSEILDNQFTADWEQTLYAKGYLLNVFQVNGQADTTEVEGFLDVGASGTPLPSGWLGNASGNYITATSSGIAVPSISLKKNGEYLQTKVYPQPVSNLTFMYRIASTSTGSSILIDAYRSGSWVRIDSILYKNTTKTYPSYLFTKTQNFKAFRFTYNKIGTGNLSIDDVQATYGNQDTTFVLKNKLVPTNQSLVNGLVENSTYFYQVKATLGTSISQPSELMKVKTTLSNGAAIHPFSATKLIRKNGDFYLAGLEGNETIQLFTVSGSSVFKGKVETNVFRLPLSQKGIFIVRVQNGQSLKTFKIIR
ncbi:MAG: endonuclease [Bacteroidales bacterium]